MAVDEDHAIPNAPGRATSPRICRAKDKIMTDDVASLRDKLIDAARIAAAQCNGILSSREFVEMSGVSRDRIYQVFEGGWRELRDAAGIAPHPSDPRRYTEEELLMEYHQVFSNLRTVPTRNHFNRMSKISWSALNVRFGSQAKIVARYGDWLRATQPESDLIERLPIEKNQSDLVSLTVSASDEPQQHKAQWAKTERTVYGEPISFRGLRHAPVNEQGVVYLFGMVSFELGFLVEAVHSAFPDCEAKRCINRKENRWQRVLIEFEFRSRNFRDHGHNPQGCDLIVCWEHDWNDCLLEVLELRKVLTTLDVSPL